MVVAPPVAESSKTVVHLGAELDDARLAAEYGQISGRTMETIPYEQTAAVEAWADVRFKGQSHEIKVRVMRHGWEEISAGFVAAYESIYGQVPANRQVEIVTLRVRRIGKSAEVKLPALSSTGYQPASPKIKHGLVAHATGEKSQVNVFTRSDILKIGPTPALSS